MQDVAPDDLITTIPEASDANGDTVTYSLKAGSDNGGRFVFDPATRKVTAGTTAFSSDILLTSYEVIIIADDAEGMTAEYTLTITLIS